MVEPVNTEDLYCLGCGYNLRGLPGDPRRCPECGCSATVEELRFPAGLLNKQAKKLESWPALMVGSLLFGMFIWVLLFIVLRGFDYGLDKAGRVGMISACIVGPVCWIGCFLAFWRQAESGSPWLLVVFQIHVASVLLLGWVVAVFVLVANVESIASGLVVVCGLFGILGWMPGYWLYRVSRKNLLKVRSAKALELARLENQKRNQRNC